MNFKRFLCLAMVLLVSLMALAACGDTPDDPTPEAKTYTVTFDSNGGSAVSAISVTENQKAIAPTEPTKLGYDFAGWYNGNTEWSFDNAVTADLTLTAKWEITNYTVTFYDGNNVLELDPKTYTITTDDITLGSASKDHYNFMGWYKDADFTENIQTIKKGTTGNLSLYAQFVVKNYGITYHLYDGVNNDGNSSSYNIETLNDAPVYFAAPTKEGYSFNGWYTDANFTGDPIEYIDEVVGDVVLYASWTELPPVEYYNINYMDGENVLALSPASYTTGNIVLLPRAAKPGYDFEGWFTTPTFDEGTEIEAIAADSTGDVTVYAKFVENDDPDPVYSITYKDGNTTLDLEPNQFTAAEEIALPLAEKAHYDFIGWYTTPDFAEGTKIEKIAVGTYDDVVLYAKFELKVYTITYFLYGGVNAEANIATYTIEDQSFRFAFPTKEGHEFCGWYTDPGFKNQIVSLSGRSGDIVLYAKWNQVDEGAIVTPPVPVGGPVSDSDEE